MRAIARIGAGLVAAGAVVVCCALGPVVVVAGIGVALGGLGLDVWLIVAAGILIAGAGALAALRRRASIARCRARAR